MIYLDYSATTKVDENVLNNFINNIDKNYSIENLKEEIRRLLNTSKDVIYTSGSTEANNRIIKGIALKYLGKDSYHIITTTLEHSSIEEQMKYLEKNGFIIDYVKLKDGVVDLNDLENKITDKTILVSINAVNSEVGILQPIDEIGKLLKKHNILFHSDMTQAIGKVKVNLENVDLVSFTAHKFYGLKGIGVILKRHDIDLIPLVYGEEYNTPLINSLKEALELSLKDIDKNYEYVKKLNNTLKEELLKIPGISINSNKYSIPHILNISIKNYKPETFLHALENYNIFISTKSACSTSNDYSKAVYSITGNMENAKTSLRISISHKTKKEEIENLINAIKQIINGDKYDK